jgi:hypothetical protein
MYPASKKPVITSQLVIIPTKKNNIIHPGANTRYNGYHHLPKN